MILFIGILFAFLALLIGSPLLALLLGSVLVLIFKFPEGYINKSLGTIFLQIGIIIIGLTMSASNAYDVTSKYFPYISVFVITVFLAGILLAKLIKVDKSLGLLIASGTAICGATAMAAIAPLIKAKPKDLLIAMGIVFIFNAIAIGVFPIIGNNIGMSNETFGAWVAMAIHDTSSVIGTAISFGGSTVETAATLKLGRTIWLIPLILTIGFFVKDNKGSKINPPLFVFIFIMALFLGSYINLTQNTILFLELISNIFLVAALFCIGTQINFQSMKGIDARTFSLAFILWIFGIALAFLLINMAI